MPSFAPSPPSLMRAMAIVEKGRASSGLTCHFPFVAPGVKARFGREGTPR